MATKTAYFDIPQIQKELVKYFSDVMERFIDTAIEFIRSEIPVGQSFEWPESWREQAREMFKPLAIEVQGNVVKGGVAPSYSNEERDELMLWVLEKGTGEVWTKPGEITWKKYMEDRGMSHATSHYRIEHWEHPGIGFMESAKKRLSVRFSVEMDTALQNIPIRIFMNNIKVK